MEKKIIYLASQSPRRRKIFEMIGCPFKVVTPRDVEEDKNPLLPEAEIVVKNARAKAQSVLADLKDGIVVGADTEVFLDGKVFGKPKDRQDAQRMLTLLSGRTHKVLTGVCVADAGRREKTISFYDESLVTFKDLSASEIGAYIDKNNVMDKAGAYAVQSSRKTIISGVKGSLWNVIGFPVEKFLKFIQKEWPQGYTFSCPDHVPASLLKE
jgi:septum formation protein